MQESKIMQYLEQTEALLKGHFLLRSGLHSDQYFQAALLLQHTTIAAELCSALAKNWQDQQIETVLSPAVGGIVVGQELGRSLGCKAIFAEKDEASNLFLRRGFKLRAGERVLIGEDVITRGGRVQQCIDLLQQYGAIPVGIACLVDRSSSKVKFEVPFQALLKLEMLTYTEADCPLCQKGLPIDQPGSK